MTAGRFFTEKELSLLIRAIASYDEDLSDRQECGEPMGHDRAALERARKVLLRIDLGRPRAGS